MLYNINVVSRLQDYDLLSTYSISKL